MKTDEATTWCNELFTTAPSPPRSINAVAADRSEDVRTSPLDVQPGMTKDMTPITTMKIPITAESPGIATMRRRSRTARRRRSTASRAGQTPPQPGERFSTSNTVRDGEIAIVTALVDESRRASDHLAIAIKIQHPALAFAPPAAGRGSRLLKGPAGNEACRVVTSPRALLCNPAVGACCVGQRRLGPRLGPSRRAKSWRREGARSARGVAGRAAFWTAGSLCSTVRW